MPSEIRRSPGQPKKEETTTISVRVLKSLKNDLMIKYKGKINRMISEYLKTL